MPTNDDTDNNENGRPDNVGYKSPPSKHRFRPGQSGNPQGRPKRPPDLKADLFDELNEPVQIKEGGRTITVSKQRAAIRALVASAMSGDARAWVLLVELRESVTGNEPTESDAAVDDSILQDFVEDEIQRRKAIESNKGSDA